MEDRKQTEVPITHVACDICGTAITNSDFVAVKQAWWYEVDGIYCDDCNRKKTDRAQKEVVEIQEGMYCKPSQPIVITSNDGFAQQGDAFEGDGTEGAFTGFMSQRLFDSLDRLNDDYHRNDKYYQRGSSPSRYWKGER